MKLQTREIRRRSALLFTRRSALAIIAYADDKDRPARLLAAIRNAIIDWRTRLESKGAAIHFSLIVPPTWREALVRKFNQLYEADVPFSKCFDGLASAAMTFYSYAGQPQYIYALRLDSFMRGEFKRVPDAEVNELPVEPPQSDTPDGRTPDPWAPHRGMMGRPPAWRLGLILAVAVIALAVVLYWRHWLP